MSRGKREVILSATI